MNDDRAIAERIKERLRQDEFLGDAEDLIAAVDELLDERDALREVVEAAREACDRWYEWRYASGEAGTRAVELTMDALYLVQVKLAALDAKGENDG